MESINQVPIGLVRLYKTESMYYIQKTCRLNLNKNGSCHKRFGQEEWLEYVGIPQGLGQKLRQGICKKLCRDLVLEIKQDRIS